MTDEHVVAIFHGYYLVDYPDELGGITTHYRVRLHILGNDSTGCHHGIFAHGHAWQNGCSCTNPRLSANVNRLAHQHMSVVKIVVIADSLIQNEDADLAMWSLRHGSSSGNCS